MDAWRRWWIGDLGRSIPPLRSLNSKDFMFLDKIPLSAEEKHGKSGRGKNNRRESRKTYNDLAFLMKYITTRVQEAGRMEEEITISSVD